MLNEQLLHSKYEVVQQLFSSCSAVEDDISVGEQMVNFPSLSSMDVGAGLMLHATNVQ